MMQCLIILTVFTTAIFANGTEDGGSVSALQKTVQSQAAAIQSLEARLTAKLQSLDTRIAKQEQVVGFFADSDRPYDEMAFLNKLPVTLRRVLTNIGNGYDNTTGIFTAPYSGLYTFSLHFMGGGGVSGTAVAIYKGDQQLARAYDYKEMKDDKSQGSSTAVVHLAKGDSVTVRLDTGPSVGVYASYYFAFAGMLVRSD